MLYVVILQYLGFVVVLCWGNFQGKCRPEYYM